MIPIAKPLLGKEEINAVKEVIESGIIASGPKTVEFEKRFADFVGTKYAIATTSGTTALHLALLSMDIEKGDEVIVPSYTFIASANTVLFCDAKPVFCDINLGTFNIDYEKIEGLITKKTKAIMPVHLYGQPADMGLIQEIAEKHGIKIIGDAAQAHGSEYNGNMVGSFGDVECFSFYPTKNMTTGEGGILTTNSSEIAEKAYSIRNHGRQKTKWGYEHGILGYNYRMTDIAAAIGLVQLKHLPDFNKKRIENARFLNENLKNVEIPYVIQNAKHVYHQYTIKCKKRNILIKNLKKNEIGFGVYYPKPLHYYEHLMEFGHINLKNSEDCSDTVLSLPVHPALEKQDLEDIVKVVNDSF
jgi:dTDP-4-amino-4,6-dideoxygalactose transaminase